MKVEFQNIYKRYGNVTAVNNLNLTIASGSFHFLLGPSGCGKTTTLRLLAGLEKVSDGRILFNGKDVTSLPSSERGIGMVFQNYALWPHMTARQNIEYGLKLRKLSTKDLRERTNEALSITHLSSYEHRLPGQLSGGQQQRVALARALAIRPNVLLLDEPLSNLDAKLRMEMRDNISRIHRETGITTFYVTHDQKEALSMGTHVTVMRNGVSIQTGTPRELYCDPHSTFLAGFIGETNVISGSLKREEGEMYVIETALGDLLAAKTSSSYKVGETIQVSVRPASIQVMEKEEIASGDNVFKLPLSYDTYLGEIEQLIFSYDSHQKLKANLYNSKHEWQLGETITIVIDPADVKVLPFEHGIYDAF
ncbi:MAG: ABC transporter ATP-binding protein [Deltaproteobacteria bacterium]|nr:ABC transporter ATP-binding protein [Deltaproteobacteria bacterium]